MQRRTLLAALPFAGHALAGAASAADRTTVRVSVVPFMSMAPFFTAYEAGYFTEAGFDVEVDRETNSMQAIPLLAGGRLDVSFVADDAGLLNAVARGARVRIVAGRELASPDCHPIGAVYVRRESFPHGLSSMKPLRGAKIAIGGGGIGTLSDYALDVLLEHDGMSRDDVQAMGMPRPQAAAALVSGAVAGFVAGGTEVVAFPQAFEFETGPVMARIQPGFQYSWIVFGSRLLDGNVATGTRFLRAYLRGANEYRKGRTPAFVDELAKSQGMDQKVLRSFCRESSEPNGAIRLADLERFVRWAIGRGMCPATLKATALVDGRFLSEMNGGI
jgi:NitT/TauT family transport system substrate-binding protein